MSQQDAAPSPDAPEVPDFDLIRPIGRGGFGRVWLAVNRTTGQLRAIKVVSLQRSGDGNPAAREISSLTRLEANLRCRHPNLLVIHHIGKTAADLFYVMDPADDFSGGPPSLDAAYRPATLQARLQEVPLSPADCLECARQLLAGLAALHAAGMAHRDVKPSNCLFVGGQLKLADFGLVTDAHPLVSRVGTQKYMPPDGRMDRRADVYAAGLVLYEMLSGLPVEDFPHLGQRALQVSRDATLTRLLHLVLRACERDPDLRFADAREMLAALETPACPPSRSRRHLVTAGVGALLAGLWLAAWAMSPERVAVSFITQPFEAKIYLDGTLLVDSDRQACTTPCTFHDLPAGEHQVAFEREGEPRWDAGTYDFHHIRQIYSRRPESP